MSYAKALTAAKNKAECAINSDTTLSDLPNASSKTTANPAKNNKQKQNKQKQNKHKQNKHKQNKHK